MNRRDFLKRSALAGAGLAVASGLQTPASAKDLFRGPALSSYTGTVKWGVFPMPRGTETTQSALTNLESAVGRAFAIQRNYQGMDKDLIGKFEYWLAGRGTTPYRTIHSWTGSTKSAIQWSDVANGAMDPYLSHQADLVKAFGQPLYLAFHHEPENDVTGTAGGQAKCGTAADFRAAYNHVRSVFDAAGVTNVTWVLTLMAGTYTGRNGGAASFEPDNYDIVAVDGYQRYPCKGSTPRSFSEIFSPARAFAQLRGKPLAIGEYATVEFNACGRTTGDPLGKANWITDAANTMKSWPEVVFACYTHEVDPGLAYWVDTSAASLAAFKAAGLDPYFN